MALKELCIGYVLLNVNWFKSRRTKWCMHSRDGENLVFKTCTLKRREPALQWYFPNLLLQSETQSSFVVAQDQCHSHSLCFQLVQSYYHIVLQDVRLATTSTALKGETLSCTLKCSLHPTSDH